MSEERHRPVSEDVSGEALASALPRGGRQIVGMSQVVCLFACSTSSAFGTVSEDVSGEALVSELPHSDSLTTQTRSSFRLIHTQTHTQTHSSLRFVHHLDSLTTQTHSYSDSLFLTQTRFRYFRTQILSCPEPLTHTHCEDVSGEALVSALPRGSRQSGDAPGFASGLWGCLKRFACLVVWTCVRATRWQQEEGGGGGGEGGRERGGGG